MIFQRQTPSEEGKLQHKSTENNSDKWANLVLVGVAVVALVVGGGLATTYEEGRINELRAQLASPSPSGSPKAAAQGQQAPASGLHAVTGTPAPTATSTKPPTTVPLTEVQLKNFSYKNSEGTVIKMTNGAASFDLTGATGTMTYVQSTTGDLDADGQPDSAALFKENDAGTGDILYLAIVLNKGGDPVLATTKSVLGDHAVVESLTFKSGVVSVKGKVQGDGNQAQEKTQSFKLVNGKLVAQ